MFLYSAWTKVPIGLRGALAKQFGIAKTMPTHVQDNRIVSDGYKIEDVEAALNVDAIQNYLGSDETDMAVLWDQLLASFEPKPVPEELVIVSETIVVEEVKAEVSPGKVEEPIETPKKRGRPIKPK